MKKILSLCLALLLLRSTCTIASAAPVGAPPAVDATIVETLFGEMYIKEVIAPQTGTSYQMLDAVLVGDTAYACMADGTVYSFTVGEEDAQKYCTVPPRPLSLNSTLYANLSADEQAAANEIPTNFATDGHALYVINIYAGRIGTLDENGITWQEACFDPAPFFSQDGWNRMVSGALIRDGQLYIMVDYYDEDFSVEHNKGIVQIDIATGATKRLPIDHLYQLAPYGEGELLILRVPSAPRQVLSVYNTQTGELRDLPLELPSGDLLCGLVYDASSDTIIYSEMNGIFSSVNGAAFERLRPYPFHYTDWSVDGFLTPDGRYALRMDGVSIIRPDKVSTEDALTMALTYKNEDLQAAFTPIHPEIVADVLIEQLTPADVAARIQGGDTTTDIFEVRVDSSFGALKQKGFAADLSESDVITRDVENLYAPVRDVLKNESGQVVAYPIRMNLNLWSVNTALWPKYFGDEAVPTTYSALFDAMLRFEDTSGPDDGELFLFEWSYTNLVKRVIISYIEQADTREVPLSFDAPELTLALEKLAACNEMMLAKGITYQNEADVFPYEEILCHSLFYTSGGGSNLITSSKKMIEENGDLLPFTFMADQTPIVHSYMSAYVVNPNSNKQELARDYIECSIAKEIDLQQYYMLHASATEPVEKADYQQKLDGYANSKSELEAQIAKLTVDDPKSADITSLQDELDRMQWYLDNVDFVRYEITPEGIAAWQKIAPFMQFFEDSLYLSTDNSVVIGPIDLLCTQYGDGRFTLGEFLKQLTSTAEMVYKEQDTTRE